MLSKSVRNMEKTGAGIFNVGAKTMPTFLTVILLTSELFTMTIKNSARARNSAKLGFGSLCTRELNAAIFFDFSSSSSLVLAQSRFSIGHQGILTKDA